MRSNNDCPDYDSIFNTYILLSVFGAALGGFAATRHFGLESFALIAVASTLIGFAFRKPQHRAITFLCTLQFAAMVAAAALLVSMSGQRILSTWLGHGLCAAYISALAAVGYLAGRVVRRRQAAAS